MLSAFPAAYQALEPGQQGPSNRGDPRDAVLGEDGVPSHYDASHDGVLRWYRYLFLGRGKPSTHVRVLSAIPSEQLAASAPEALRELIGHVRSKLEPAAAPR